MASAREPARPSAAARFWCEPVVRPARNITQSAPAHTIRSPLESSRPRWSWARSGTACNRRTQLSPGVARPPARQRPHAANPSTPPGRRDLWHKERQRPLTAKCNWHRLSAACLVASAPSPTARLRGRRQKSPEILLMHALIRAAAPQAQKKGP
jgi:hypothetical protein